MSLKGKTIITMKKIFLGLFLLAMTLVSWSATSDVEKLGLSKENKISPDDNNEASIVRLQNKVIAGIEMSLNPAHTANPAIDSDGNFMFRTLANFRIGYRVKQHVITGSLGVEFTDEMFMPITADYKYYFKYDQKWSPYVYGQVGYSWHLKGNINSGYSSSNYVQIDPGALASVGLGYSVTTTLNEFYFSVGYAYRDYVEVRVVSSSGRTEDLDRTNNGVAFTVGFNF